MAEHEIHEDHGHSVAAWTAVGILLVGTAVMSWAVVATSVALFVVGAVICVVGVVAGKVLGMAGYGAKDVPPVTSDSQKTSGIS
ncbi:MAG: HGxxPAAW family protein [Pedococcus sp.]